MKIFNNIKLIPNILKLLQDIINTLNIIHESLSTVDKHVYYIKNDIVQKINSSNKNISNRLDELSGETLIDTSIHKDWLKAKDDGIVYMINKNIESLGYSIGVNEKGEAIIINFPIKISIEDEKIGLSKYMKFLDNKINKNKGE